MREERGEAIAGIISGATNTTYGRCTLDRLILYSNEGAALWKGEVKLCTLKKSPRSSLSSSRRVKQKIGLSKCILDICRISIDTRIQRLIRIKTAGSGRCYAYAYQNETRIIREKNLIDERASRLAIVQSRKACILRLHRYLVRIRGPRAPRPIAPGVIRSFGNRRNNEPVRGCAYVGKRVPRRQLRWINVVLHLENKDRLRRERRRWQEEMHIRDRGYVQENCL